MPKPVSIIKNRERVRIWEREKAIRPMPKMLAAMAIIFHRPLCPFLEARYSAPDNAPTPVAAISRPSVFGPP